MSGVIKKYSFLDMAITKNIDAPERAYRWDAGIDLFVPEDTEVGRDITMIDLCVMASIPRGYFGLLTLRSSWAKKLCMPSIGVIDCGYSGNIHLLVFAPWYDVFIKAGSRVAQLVMIPISNALPNMISISDMQWQDNDRKTGGFGSTGDKKR